MDDLLDFLQSKLQSAEQFESDAAVAGDFGQAAKMKKSQVSARFRNLVFPESNAFD